MRRPITARQQQVLDAIDRLTEEHGTPPTIRELCEEMGCSSPNAMSGHFKALEAAGLLKRRSYKVRSLQTVTQRDSLPLLGTIGPGGCIQWW